MSLERHDYIFITPSAFVAVEEIWDIAPTIKGFKFIREDGTQRTVIVEHPESYWSVKPIFSCARPAAFVSHHAVDCSNEELSVVIIR